MAKTLNVYFHERMIGKLVQDDHGDISFTYLIDKSLQESERKTLTTSLATGRRILVDVCID